MGFHSYFLQNTFIWEEISVEYLYRKHCVHSNTSVTVRSTRARHRNHRTMTVSKFKTSFRIAFAVTNHVWNDEPIRSQHVDVASWSEQPQ